MKHFERITERPASPLTLAKQILQTNKTLEETRTAHAITGDIIRLYSDMSARWEKFKEYQLWEQNGKIGAEPTFLDEENQEQRSGKDALNPSKLTTSTYHKARGMGHKSYSPRKLSGIQKIMERNPEVSHAIHELRQILIYIDEIAEHEMVKHIFEALDHYKESYKSIIIDIIKKENTGNLDVLSPASPEEKIRLLKALVVDLPTKYKEETGNDNIRVIRFDNYYTLTRAEILLLTTPFMLQNSDAPYFYSSVGDLLKNNPIVKAVAAISSKYPEGEEAERAVEHFIDCFPEIFGMQNMKNKTSTFVGAGLPMSGLIQHILTGCNVNLVDYNAEACNTALALLEITDRLGITEKGKFRVLNADARDVNYVSPEYIKEYIKDFRSHEVKHVGKQKYTIETDILDLAGALPYDVTREVVENNANDLLLLRKRHVKGMSELFYETFSLPPGSIFRLTGEVTPPQKVISGVSPASIVTGIMSPINVNTTDLYVNTSHLREKAEFLTSLVDTEEIGDSKTFVSETPDTQVLSGGEVQWNARTMTYYRQ